MSASSKKKLRKEQSVMQMTERQLQEEKERKKLKTYTISFVAVMAVVLCIALVVLGVRAVNQSGYFQKKTIALQVGEHKLNSVELSYFFGDAISENYNQWYESYGQNLGAYLSIVGLDINKSLDKQIYNKSTGETWADNFLNIAVSNAQDNYALYDAAMKADFKLSDEAKKEIDTQIQNLEFWAMYSGFDSVEKYLGYTFSYGATVESYRKYLELGKIAEEYYDEYMQSLEYDDTAIRAHETGKYINYSSFSYVNVYFDYKDFLKGGTVGEDNKTTYSKEDEDAARAAAKAAAESLLTAKTVEELKAAVEALEINKKPEGTTGTFTPPVTADEQKNTRYVAIDTNLRDWIASDKRKPGDITLTENTFTSGEGENATTTIYGYYVTMFLSSSNNEVPMHNVRHLLVAFGSDSTKEYTAEEKAAAKKKAEDLLKQWQDSTEGATEETFIKLVKEKSEDNGTKADGGLIENISYDANLVEPFLNWAIDSKRQPKDVEIIESTYGYHIMFYVEKSEMNYRDYLISQELRSNDMQKWYADLLKATETKLLDTSWINKDTSIAG